ncbi:hypothetical protein [Methylobacterium sp. SD21]|uniref:hypothetical protein n=1 Tax=Methylobacterium litchii TaxID=3138810 RepID=UPI00313DBF66
MKRLDEILASELPKLRVENNQYLSYASVAGLTALDKALSNRKDERRDLVAMIDDGPVVDFVLDRISRRLSDREVYNPEAAERPLTELSSFADPSAISREIVAEFDTLPWDYTFTFPLPQAISERVGPLLDQLGSITLSDDVKLVLGTGLAEGAYPLPEPAAPGTGLGAFFSGLLVQPEWNAEGVYLQVRCRGYVDRYGLTGTARDATAILHAFIGIGIAQHVFRYDWRVPTFLASPRFTYHVHVNQGDGWRHNGTVEPEGTLATAFSNMACVEFHDLKTFGKMMGWAFTKVRTCFTHPKKADRIVRAAQWLFDSHASRNQTLAFLQSMVALEILLGERAVTELVGIGTLLSNRCAYLIGKSQAQREELLSDFGALYKVRSDIVHSGKNRLSNSETNMLNKLRWICARAIQEEIDLLEQDVRKV